MKNLPPWSKHLIASAIGTGVVIAAIKLLPLWVVGIIVFGGLFLVINNNTLNGRI